MKTSFTIKEYRNNEEKTKELFTDDGFLRTGYVLVQKILRTAAELIVN